MLGLGRFRCPETYHPTGRIQMPGVPARPAVARFQESSAMPAEFYSAAGVPGAGSSPRGRSWHAFNRQCGLQRSSGHSSRAKLGQKHCSSDIANTVRGPGAGGVPSLPLLCSRAPAPQQDHFQSFPTDRAAAAGTSPTLVIVGSMHDVLTLRTFKQIKIKFT